MKSSLVSIEKSLTFIFSSKSFTRYFLCPFASGIASAQALGHCSSVFSMTRGHICITLASADPNVMEAQHEWMHMLIYADWIRQTLIRSVCLHFPSMYLLFPLCYRKLQFGKEVAPLLEDSRSRRIFRRGAGRGANMGGQEGGDCEESN